jgi:glycosyltransferase involved in cell wall biosynthesis
MKNDKINVVACTLSQGKGNGIAEIDNMLWEGVDRKKINLKYTYTSITKNQKPHGASYQIFVPLENRIETLEKIFYDADIVQFNGGVDPVACDAAKKSGVPSVVEIMHQCERGQRMRNIDLTVCVSKQVMNFQPNAQRCLVINNGINVNHYKPNKNARSKNKFVILQVARKNKKLHFNIEDIAEKIFSLDPRIEIWMVGSGLPMKERFQGRLKLLGVQQDMVSIYQKSDVMLLASVEEPFGLACVESMSCGCLPVVSADGAMADIVDHSKNGWLMDKNLHQTGINYIKEAIKLKDSEEIIKMQKEARKKIIYSYSSSKMIKCYEQLYSSLVEMNGKKRKDFFLNKKKISAESLIIHTAFLIQAGISIEKIIEPWIDIDMNSVSPLAEPSDPANLTWIDFVLKFFMKIKELGYAQLSSYLVKMLKYIASMK